MSTFLKDWARSVGWYLAVLAVGLVVTLTVSSAVGYLPYSDRPGPGWTEPSFSLRQVGYYLSWASLLLIPSAIYGSALFGYHRLLRCLGAPLLLVRVVGGAAAGILSFYTAAGVGWYISMAPFPAWVGAALGALWGAALLPRYLGDVRLEHGISARSAVLSVVLLGGAGVLYLALFVPQQGQVLELNVVRLTKSADGSRAEGWERNLRAEEAALLDSLALRGRLDLGLSSYSVAGDRTDTARALILFTGPLRRNVRLAVPEGVPVVYVQRGSEWGMFPADAPTLRDHVKIEGGTDPNEVIFTLSDGSPSTIRWVEAR